MPLLLTGRGFRRDLERSGALALYVPLEGGSETRLLRRLRAAGYDRPFTPLEDGVARYVRGHLAAADPYL
jgi:hypothetical protein